MAAYLGCVSEL
uniref:Uncharacterized protein n=1 Tax=Arundo donax TaxID=35708 RepID=A0A0A9B115_ARUDO